jgi:predicted DNA-binding protein
MKKKNLNFNIRMAADELRALKRLSRAINTPASQIVRAGIKKEIAEFKRTRAELQEAQTTSA